jgi:non-haem Fe2+, alpha-ketoglutarate-dependent halogenase
MSVLSDADVRRYQSDGALFPIPVLSPTEVARFRGAFEALSARIGGTPSAIRLPHLFFRWAYDLATHAAVVDAVAAILGEDVVAQSSLVLCKHPGDPSYTSWHQDGLASGWHLTPSVSAWIALSDSTTESGCMKFVPRSHHGAMLPHRYTRAPHNLLREGEEVELQIEESEAVPIELVAGEMSLHHARTVHASSPNRSREKRIGFIVRFVTPAYRFPRAPHPVVRARGGVASPHLEWLEPIPADDDAVEPWRRFLESRGLAASSGY